MTENTFESVEYVIRNGRAEISLNRPDKLNAFNENMIKELDRAINNALNSNDVYVIGITGNGRGFCAGADVTDMDSDYRKDKTSYEPHLRRVQSIVRNLYSGNKPTVAAINGPAVGAGCDFALACDLRIMSESAMLRQQFINIGLVPGDGGGWLLPKLIGESLAKDIILTGRDISPEEAKRVGLVSNVIDDKLLIEEFVNIMKILAEKPKVAMEQTKKLMNDNQSFEDYSTAAVSAQWNCINDSEHKYAVEKIKNGESPAIERNHKAD